VSRKLFDVTSWPTDGSAESREVHGTDHRDAAKQSGLSQPGSSVTVDDRSGSHVRFGVGSDGRLREQSTYNY
jgi:hypothetical protein